MSGVIGRPIPDQDNRESASHDLRIQACSLSDRGQARTVANGEELDYGDTFAANFHKGLPHGPTGFVDPSAYRSCVDALLHQDHARFEGAPLGDNFPSASFPRRTTGGKDSHRKMTSPFTGHVFDLQGVDAGSLALPAAPRLGSDELAGEMAEVYAMALLRDAKFEDIASGAGTAAGLAADLAAMPWFSSDPTAIGDRRRHIQTPADLFRGSTDGSKNGPWLSQFLLVGNQGPGGANTTPPLSVRALPEVDDGFVYYGTQFVDQRSVVAKAGCDWMQTWQAWLDAQNGVDFGGLDLLDERRQFLTTPRDIATYVHYDALYQAYQVACLLMLAGGAPFGKDRGLPESNSRTRSAFASYGGPHILSLVTEVATRALKLVWRQKWMHHRRLRPEVVAGLLTLYANDPAAVPDPALSSALAELQAKLPANILNAIAAKNTADTSGATATVSAGAVQPNALSAGLPTIDPARNYLLPMAFPEGSPTHPAYGAGHATVAGACVTALKAFFEMYEADGVTELPWPLMAGQGPNGSGAYGFGKVYVGNNASLKRAQGAPNLTVQGELDKLAANIAIARNIAGVHYYTDYHASLRMGERLTVSILEEQAALYGERMSMSFTSFDGDRIRVSGQGGTATVSVVDRANHAVPTADWYQRYA